MKHTKLQQLIKINKQYSTLKLANDGEVKYRPKRQAKLDTMIFHLFYPHKDIPMANEMFKDDEKYVYGTIQFVNATLMLQKYILPNTKFTSAVNLNSFEKTIDILNKKYLYSNVMTIINEFTDLKPVIDSGYGQYLTSARQYLHQYHIGGLKLNEYQYKQILKMMVKTLAPYNTNLMHSHPIKNNLLTLWWIAQQQKHTRLNN